MHGHLIRYLRRVECVLDSESGAEMAKVVVPVAELDRTISGFLVESPGRVGGLILPEMSDVIAIFVFKADLRSRIEAHWIDEVFWVEEVSRRLLLKPEKVDLVGLGLQPPEQYIQNVPRS